MGTSWWSKNWESLKQNILGVVIDRDLSLIDIFPCQEYQI